MKLLDYAKIEAIYIAPGYTDLRKGIDGLAMIVQNQLKLNPFSSTLFLFCGRRTSKIKGLLWEGDGFLLLNKALVDGKFQWPRTESEALKLSDQQIRWLLEGLSIFQKQSIHTVRPKTVV